jgi:Regulator of ribonuclease activity B
MNNWFNVLSIGFSLLLLAIMLWHIWARSRPTADGDLKVIQRLRREGADLTKAHSIDFFLYFPGEQAARSAADHVQATGFNAKVEPSSYDQNWLCLATKDLVPTHGALHGIRIQFEELAFRLGGEYDGWHTEILRPD